MIVSGAAAVRSLRALERAKRLAVLGAIVVLYAGGWLLLSWHASLVGQTECTVERVKTSSLCTVVHHAPDGEEHTLPWDDCRAPTRWPPIAVGVTFPCFYYRARPDDMFFEARPPIAWASPAFLVALGLGLAILAASAVARVRAPRVVRRSGTADAPDVDAAPLVVPRASRTGCIAWAFASPFAGLGAVLSLLLVYVEWTTTGEFPFGLLFFNWFANGVAYAGFYGLWHRSGIVFDARRGVFQLWWGIGRPWFCRWEAMERLQGATVGTDSEGRARRYSVVLQLEDRTLRVDMGDAMFDQEKVARVVADIRSYVGLRDGHGEPSAGADGPVLR